MIEPIEIPDATREPAAYVEALVRTLGQREPLEVLRGTPATARELCRGLDDRGWRTPMAGGEWTPLQVVGHLLDVDIVYGFRWRLILTEDRPSYPGYDEKAWSLLPRPDPDRLLGALEGLRAANLAMLEGVTDANRDASASTANRARSASSSPSTRSPATTWPTSISSPARSRPSPPRRARARMRRPGARTDRSRARAARL